MFCYPVQDESFEQLVGVASREIGRKLFRNGPLWASARASELLKNEVASRVRAQTA